MVNGKQRAARFLVASQAALVWANEGTDVQGFIETGSLETVSATMPYCPVVSEALAADSKGHGKEFIDALIRKAQAEQAAKEVEVCHR